MEIDLSTSSDVNEAYLKADISDTVNCLISFDIPGSSKVVLMFFKIFKPLLFDTPFFNLIFNKFTDSSTNCFNFPVSFQKQDHLFY